MGFYSNKVSEGFVSESLESLVDNDSVTVCESEDFQEAALMAVAESEANYNAIMRAIGIEECAVFAETGKEKVYTEGVFGDVVQKVKEFILKIWDKIKQLFKRFMAMIGIYSKSDKEFLSKYKKDIVLRMGKLKDFKYNGYNFTLDAANSTAAFVDVSGTTKTQLADGSKADVLDKFEEDFDDKIESLRGEALGKSGESFTASEFTKELFSLLRDGEDSKTELDNIDLSAIMRELESSDKTKKDTKTAYDKSLKMINKAVKDVEASGKKLSFKDTDKDKAEVASAAARTFNLQARYLKSALIILQAHNGGVLQAIKDRSRQNKAICAKVIGTVSESTTAGEWEHPVYESGSSFLAGVELK